MVSVIPNDKELLNKKILTLKKLNINILEIFYDFLIFFYWEVE